MSLRCLSWFPLFLLSFASLGESVRRKNTDAISSFLERSQKSGSSAAGGAMSKVVSALQSAHTSQMSLKATPGMIKVFQDLKDDMLNNVIVKIQQDHSDTQSEIISRVAAVVDAADDVVTSFQAAVDKSKEWNQCIEAEKTLLEEKETAIKSASTASGHIDAPDGPCAEEKKTEHYTQTEYGLTFSCDLMTGNCGAKESFVEEKATALIKKVSNAYSLKNSTHTQAEEACDYWKNEKAQQEKIANDAESGYGSKSDGCETVHNEFVGAGGKMCTSGQALQTKCTKKGLYDDLIRDIDGTGSEYSEPDRQKEYAVSMQVLCIIEQFIQNDAVSLDECAPADYASDVGVLDLKKASVDAKMTGVYYTCAESQINFPDGTWHLNVNPKSADVKSSDYSLVDPWNPAFALVGDPFAYCASSAYPPLTPTGPTAAPVTCAKGDPEDEGEEFYCGKCQTISEALCDASGCTSDVCCDCR